MLYLVLVGCFSFDGPERESILGSDTGPGIIEGLLDDTAPGWLECVEDVRACARGRWASARSHEGVAVLGTIVIQRTLEIGEATSSSTLRLHDGDGTELYARTVEDLSVSIGEDGTFQLDVSELMPLGTVAPEDLLAIEQPGLLEAFPSVVVDALSERVTSAGPLTYVKLDNREGWGDSFSAGAACSLEECPVCVVLSGTDDACPCEVSGCE